MSSKFGSLFDENWPVSQAEYTEFGRRLLQGCSDIKRPKPLDLDEINKKSSEFPIKFPISTCRIITQPKDRQYIIKEQAASAYPVIHERVLWLFTRFLEHKIQHGSQIEKDIFSNMSLPQFVQRLLTKRCVSFFGKNDKYLLLSGERGASGFVEIGTETEIPPLLLRNCLSYDEIKLSALLSVSSHSEFINDGNRKNLGKIEPKKNKIERNGVIIGIIGARLSRRDLMEFQDIVISKTQNTVLNGYSSKESVAGNPVAQKKLGYRKLWNDFYNEKGILFDKIKKDGKRFGDSRNKNDIFDNLVMKKRYAISFDTLLLESEARAAKSDQKAYIHVVGIGLGVWKAAQQQEEIFLETFSQRLKVLLPKLNHVSFIHFSWFHMEKCGEIKNGNLFKSDEHPNGGIRVFISKRNPADKLGGVSASHVAITATIGIRPITFPLQRGPELENTLLIVSYAWDGNALPGNEFWVGMLSSTGDPAAACSSLISELHNPHINENMVSGDNLHIASQDFGVLHIAKYARKKLSAEQPTCS